jgi:hypothetical protein
MKKEELKEILMDSPIVYAQKVLDYKKEKDPQLRYFRSAQDKEEPTIEVLTARALFAGLNAYKGYFDNYFERIKNEARGKTERVVYYTYFRSDVDLNFSGHLFACDIVSAAKKLKKEFIKIYGDSAKYCEIIEMYYEKPNKFMQP